MIPRLPNPPLHESIAEIPEGELVRRLLADPYTHEFLFGIKGMPEAARVFQRTDLRNAPGGLLGDADMILVAPDHPEAAVAFEVKRIKVGPSAFASGQPNKLHEYEKAVGQANRLADVGFSQVYLYVIVVVDSRIKNDGRYTYDGLTPELDGIIRGALSLEHLQPRVGMVVHEFVQPMDHPPLVLGTYGGHLERPATQVPQRTDLTEWLGKLLEDGAA